MEEAPNEKPVITVMTLLTSHHMLLNARKSTPSPRTPNPTTPMPTREPPAKATSKALPSELRAALVVRTLARVATFIPMYPASAEQIAPSVKEIKIRGDEASVLLLTASSMATATTKKART